MSYDLGNDVLDKIDKMGLVGYEYVSDEELSERY